MLFYNPVSGHAAFKNKLDWMVEAFQRRGILVVFYRTRKEGNEAFIPFVREVNPDGLLVAGGDGTVHEIVNLMMRGHLDLPLGIIGSGTSNDFATYLGVNADLEAYLDTIVSGRSRRVDLGLVDGTYFINVASGGAMACIAHEVNVRIKNSLGKMAYYLKGIGDLPKFRYFPLKIMAKELQVPVLCLSQLSRANEKRDDKRPMLSDLRESGAIEQDADIVLFLYRDDYYNEDSEKHNIAECIVAKNRHGETGKVELRWMPEYTTFGTLERRYEDE